MIGKKIRLPRKIHHSCSRGKSFDGAIFHHINNQVAKYSTKIAPIV